MICRADTDRLDYNKLLVLVLEAYCKYELKYDIASDIYVYEGY